MGDQAFGIAQIVGQPHQPQGVLKGKGRFLATLHFKCHQRRASGHLAGNDVGLRVIGAARINHAGDCAAFSQMVGNARRIAGLLRNTQWQGFKTLEHDPGIERRQGRAGMPEVIMQVLVDPILA